MHKIIPAIAIILTVNRLMIPLEEDATLQPMILSYEYNHGLNEQLNGLIYYPTLIRNLLTPTSEEVEYVAKTIHGEAGICDRRQKQAVAWCICNRVDCPDYPDNIIDVVIQPYQFHGYSLDKQPTDEEYDIARSVLTAWMNGIEDLRILPKEYLFFHSNGKGINIFTTQYRRGKEWQ